jgi:hypothetical protein
MIVEDEIIGKFGQYDSQELKCRAEKTIEFGMLIFGISYKKS